MTRDEFSLLLAQCTRQCVDLAKRYIVEALPESYTYQLLPNQSCDDHQLEDDQTLYPEDSQPSLDDHISLDHDGVVNFLWRNGATPEWIDISVVDITASETVIELLCCGRFTGISTRLYYHAQGTGPFGIKSPALPADYIDGAKFNLFNPREKRQKRR